ncbi:helix-turn-helix domain-containing protein [Oceanobacillus kimchii]|uniref:helix-turn-helix domain-containing protein n=1 Tax=Oceanobacillus kimchii TaxID=746691 RepID=UPI0003465DA1|nr:helix-turn-helix domain-containing protein [Oceanobacillus kimchii]
MDVGAKLKEARLSSGISLDSLQETTKIQKRYLVAIEEGNLHILPGKFYARAFIKEYATAVGLDPNELLEEHREELPSTEEENVQYTRIQRTRRENNSNDKGSRISSSIPSIIVVLLVIGIIIVAWLFIRANSSDATDPSEEPQENNVIIEDGTNDSNTDSGEGTSNEGEEENNEENGDAAEDNNESEDSPSEELSVEVIEEGTGSSPNSVIGVSNYGDEVTVSVDVTGDGEESWLEVTSGSGESLFSSVFNAEAAPQEWDASDFDSISLNVGYAPAVTISINGTEIEYPVDMSTVHQKLEIQFN